MSPIPVSAPTGRFPEIDLLRGVAVGLMIIYHVFFDLVFFAGESWDLSGEIIWIIGRSAAVLFVGLAGLSIGLAWKRKHQENKISLLLRGAQILGMGIALTGFTWIFFPTYVIWFGILHLIGTAIILGTFLLPHPRLTFILGMIFTFFGVLFSLPAYAGKIPFLIPLFPAAFPTFDYVPLFPWLGLFLLGMSAGDYFFPSGRQRHIIVFDTCNAISKTLIWGGRNSLLLYFIHQPILVGIIWLFTYGI